MITPRFHVPGPASFVLLPIDEPGHLPRGPALFVEIEAAKDPLDQPLLIIRVQNLKVFREPRFLPVGPQEAVSKAMEGSHP